MVGAGVAAVSGSVTLPRRLALEALACLHTRARWYDLRGFHLPEHLDLALKYLCTELNVDVSQVEAALRREGVR